MERSRVQAFGHLIVLDQNLTIVGMSELVIQKLKHSTFLNQPVDELLSYLLPKTKIRNKKLLQLFANSSLQQTVVSKTLFNQEHHLKIHKVQKHIFIEFEKKISDPFTTVGEDFDFVFENNNYSNWNNYYFQRQS